MKILFIILAVMFIIVSLGLVDVELSFSDGTKFTYRSWLHWFLEV